MTDHDLTNHGSYKYLEPVTIRYSDQDPMRHVNNVAISAFFESGRVGLFHRLGKLAGESLEGMVLAHFTVDYVGEVHYPGKVEVGGKLLTIGRKSLTTGYGLFQDGVCCATSLSVNVFFDVATRSSVEPSPAVRAALERDLVNGG